MPSPLTKAGFRTQRNLAKQYRPVRMNADGTIHNMDNLFSGGIRPVNTTGCFGNISSFGIRPKQLGPQSGRRVERRKKHRCRLPSTAEITRSHSQTNILEVRQALLKLRYLGDLYNKEFLTPRMAKVLTQLSEIAFSKFDSQLLISEDRKVENAIRAKFFNKQSAGKFDLYKMIKQANSCINHLR